MRPSMTGQCLHPIFTCFHTFPHVNFGLTLHVMTLVYRYPSSSQDSAASSLTADKTPHRQDRSLTPETLQSRGNTNTNRRKRLVRQFSLWVHVTSDNCWRAKLQEGNCTLEMNTPQYLKQKQCYRCSLKMTFCSAQSAGHVNHSVPLNLLPVSNHEDEDNLPEALAAISSQSTGKSGSTSSLDKQIQPSIYPQVTLSPMHTHIH